VATNVRTRTRELVYGANAVGEPDGVSGKVSNEKEGFSECFSPLRKFHRETGQTRVTRAIFSTRTRAGVIESQDGAGRLFTPSRAIAFARFMEITPAAEAASDKPFSFSAADTARVAKKLSWHTGKAAWTFGTSFLLLVVPLIIQLHREEQMMALEQEQLSVLNSGGGATSSEPAK